MLTPATINALVQNITTKHAKPSFGLYSPHKKILNYISNQFSRIERANQLSQLEKVIQMLNLLEGLARYFKDLNPIIEIEVEKILTYIYYPDNEEITLNNKDNLLLGSKGQTVRLWHDNYYQNNRNSIFNRFLDCREQVYTRKNYQYLTEKSKGMPEQMQKNYEHMFLEKSPLRTHSPKASSASI